MIFSNCMVCRKRFRKFGSTKTCAAHRLTIPENRRSRARAKYQIKHPVQLANCGRCKKEIRRKSGRHSFCGRCRAARKKFLQRQWYERNVTLPTYRLRRAENARNFNRRHRDRLGALRAAKTAALKYLMTMGVSINDLR